MVLLEGDLARLIVEGDGKRDCCVAEVIRLSPWIKHH